jgi:hypothetical protein
MEQYNNGHSVTTSGYWFTMGKTTMATINGIGEQEVFLNINSKVSAYIGTRWTNRPLKKENLITNKQLLTITSHITDMVNDSAITPLSSRYKVDNHNSGIYRRTSKIRYYLPQSQLQFSVHVIK